MKWMRSILPTAAVLFAGVGVSQGRAQDLQKPSVLRTPLAAVAMDLPAAPVPIYSAAATVPNAAVPDGPTYPDAPAVSGTPRPLGPDLADTSSPVNGTVTNGGPDATPGDPQDGQQSKRILFIIPNFRAVSASVKLPPLSNKAKLKLAISDSFDYSSFIYVGMLAGVDQLQSATPEFGQGAKGYGRYYWHSFADNTSGNLMTEAVFPILTHEDPRYYTLGHGGFIKRLGYSLGRLVITRPDGGGSTFNISEIAGNGISAAASDLYYPSPERTAGKTIDKWVLQIGLDGASNVLKEFWPDVSQAFSHHPSPAPAATQP